MLFDPLVEDIAWIRTDDGFAISRWARAVQAPSSPVISLVQGLWDRLGPETLRVVRRPIFVSRRPWELELDFVKVAAKSLRMADPAELRDPDAVIRDFSPMEAGAALPAYRREADEYQVRAILFDEKGRNRLEARRQAAWNRTLHAEILLVQDWYRLSGRRIPAGWRVHVTHKPCRMCASMLLYWSEEPEKVDVTFESFVGGCRSRRTALDRRLPSGVGVQTGLFESLDEGGKSTHLLFK